ncbi:MAG: secretin N-terminal domain-containing protein [Planctomycetota bacterium]|jgi:type IV pilus assembly protein PilQ
MLGFQSYVRVLIIVISLVSVSDIYAQDVTNSEESNNESYIAKINLSYRRAPLSRVLDRIARSAGGMNIKIQVDDEEELQELERQAVTVELTGVNWKTALEFIAKKYKYVINKAMEQNGLILLEKPPRITMNVQNAPIENVIKLIASDAQANIIIGPEVSGNISFTIHDVPWKEALDSILKTHGYIKVEEDSGVIRITTPEKVQQQMEVKVFALRYISAEGSRYKAKLSSDYVERTGTNADNDFSLLQVLEQVKSPEGSISYERRTNQLIVKDTATKIEEISGVIREMDIAPLQVKIATRIITKTYEGDDDMGINWQNGFTATTNGGSWQTAFPFSPYASDGTIGSWGYLGPLSAIATDAYNLPTPMSKIDRTDQVDTGRTVAGGYGTLNFGALQATLQMMKYDKNTKLVQAPQIVALDNEEATIHIGDVIRYAEFSTETTDSGVSSGYNAAAPLYLGVQLLVVPQVIREADKILLTVIPKTEDLDSWKTYVGDSNTLELPQTKSKTVVTRMMLSNNETGIIAGLFSNQLTTEERKVPIFGDIPVVGKLFKSRTADPKTDDVSVLITPTILRETDGKDFEEELAALREAADLSE